MKKYFFVLIGFLLVNSAYAYLDENSTCTSSTMNAASGNISLEAVEVPNVINIQWENADGTTYTTSTCTYDTQLQIPVAPTRLGYTFDGWTLEEACSLSNLDTSIDAGTFACLDLNGNGSCRLVANASLYGLDTPGQLAVPFSYGTVFGMAKCSALPGNNHDWQWGGNSADWTATESELTNASGEAKYCWCRATAYTPSGGNQCQLSSSSWVFDRDYASGNSCALDCAYVCGKCVGYELGCRAVLFGAAQ